MNSRQWESYVQHWLLYTFVLFVCLMCLCTFLSYGAQPCDFPSNDFYLITSLLFFSTLVVKLVLMSHQKTFKNTSICNLVVYLYGLTTHVLLFIRPQVFLIKFNNECLPTVEYLQWCLTCPLLYLSLFSSANKKTDWAAQVVIIEHLSIVASALATLAPPRHAVIIVTVATVLSLCAKASMVQLFYPATKVLDRELLPFLVAIVVLYVTFPLIFAMRMLGKITSLTELTLFAFNDVFIKIVYAIVLEVIDQKVDVLQTIDVLGAQKKDTVEKLFLRYIFHEVRNPLSVLNNAVDELAEKNGEHEYIQSFRQGIDGFSRLLDDLKQMIELQSGQLLLDQMPINLLDLVTNGIIKTQPSCESNVEVTSDESLPLLMGDHYRLTQLTMSIMYFCLQHRDDTHKVKVHIRVVSVFGSVYCIALEFTFVANEFSDISNHRPELIKLRSELYPSRYSLEYTFNWKLAEHICALYHGTIDSTTEFDKTTVKITLQMTGHREREMMDVPEDGLKLLLVDDNALQVRALQGLCKPHVSLVESAFDGQQAIQLAKKHHFDLCLMDIVMPKTNGIEATRAIRSFDKDIIIYGISGNGFRSDFEQMILAGAVKVFSKPVDKKEILKILDEMKIKKMLKEE